MTMSQSSSLMRMMSVSRVVPALLTRMSMRPKAFLAASIRAWASATWLTSAWTAMASPPRASIWATTSLAAALLLR